MYRVETVGEDVDAATEALPYEARSGPALRRVRQALADVVAAEGPVEATRLARAVAVDFGLSRVNADRREAILACLPADLLRDGDGFVWPPETDPRGWSGYRAAGSESDRKLDEISLREIANAMDHLEAGTGGMDEAELFRDTLAEFGFLRMTDGVRGRLAAATRLRRTRPDG
jgi:hypothetical protein